MLRLNKIAILSVICSMLIVVCGCKSSSQTEQNVLANMQDGKNDHTISSTYAEDISLVESMTSVKNTGIQYYDCNLNEDDVMDKIVTIRSPLHSSSHGDSLDFLISNDDGSYHQLSGLIVPLYGQDKDHPNSKMYILESKTNGFYDISIIKPDNTEILLKYQDGSYQPV